MAASEITIADLPTGTNWYIVNPGGINAIQADPAYAGPDRAQALDRLIALIAQGVDVLPGKRFRPNPTDAYVAVARVDRIGKQRLLGPAMLDEEDALLSEARAAIQTEAVTDDGFGGHEFEYEQVTDLFRCTECRVYEVAARDADGPIKPCAGMVGYGGDTERVYLLLTENPALPDHVVASLATSIRSTGIGRAPRFSWRDGRLLVESAPSVVADLTRRIELITYTIDGRQVPAVSSVDHITAEAGRSIIAENYAAYVAEYGEPA